MSAINIVELSQDYFEQEYYNQSGISLIPINKNGNIALLKGYGTLVKYIKSKDTEIQVNIPAHVDCKIDNNSIDVYLPLIYLANDIALQVFISLIVDYLKDALAGKLRKEKEVVHLDVEFQDITTGKNLKINYKGDVEGLKEIPNVIEKTVGRDV